MTRVDPLPLIRAAQQSGYAVGSCDMRGVETTEALVGAAERSRSAAFLQMSRAIVPHPGLAAAADTTRRVADTSDVEVVLNLDQGPWGECVEAIRLGLGSIMYDGAHLLNADTFLRLASRRGVEETWPAGGRRLDEAHASGRDRMIDTAIDELRQYGYVGLPLVSA